MAAWPRYEPIPAAKAVHAITEAAKDTGRGGAVVQSRPERQPARLCCSDALCV
jgi:hypothetical protein